MATKLSIPFHTHNSKDMQPKQKINAIVTYSISNIVSGTKESLVDRGANRGLAGEDVRVICAHEPPRFINFSGIDIHQLNILPIVTAGAVAPSQQGNVIVIMHQYAHLGTGNTIHSCIQLEAYKSKVDDRAIYHRGA